MDSGFPVFLFHVTVAYHFQYMWSHSLAVSPTAEQTKKQIGFEFGTGIYFNFLFLICWGVDVFWSWLPPKRGNRIVKCLRILGIVYMCNHRFRLNQNHRVEVLRYGWFPL